LESLQAKAIIEESSVLDSNGVNFIQINKTKQLNSKEFKMAKGKEVTIFEEQFPMISSENNSVIEAMKNNLENEEISRRDMFKLIANPSSGDEAWSIDTPMGKQSFDELEGVILYIGNERAYYENPYGTGDNERPLCSSDEGINGHGDPGGKCVDCDLSKFGPDSEPPICSQKKPMYLLIPEVNPVMPVVINVTGPSFPELKKFRVGLMQFGVNTFDVKIRLTLKASKTKNNMPSSVLQFKTMGNFRNEDAAGYAKLVKYRESILSFIDPTYQEAKKEASA